MDHPATSFTPLLIVVFLGFIVPIALSRFKALRLPIVVGEILAGILIGRSGLGWVSSNDPTLDFMAEFGFIFLMFLSGMEIDFSSLRWGGSQGKRQRINLLEPLPLAIVNFSLTLVLAVIIGLGLVQLGLARNPWMMGLILSTTSLGVVVPVLKEKGVIGSSYGQSILLAALIADFATMLLITILVAVLSRGITFDVLLVGLLFVAFIVALRFGRSFNRLPGVRRVFDELSHATAQIKIRLVFALMLAFVVLSQALGTEVILGAFLAGACIALLITPKDEQLTHQLETIGYGFLIPIFFIKVGIDFNLSALLASPGAMLLVPLLVLAALVVKFVPALVFRLRYRWRETLSMGALLSSRLSLIIAAAAIGTRLGVISESTNGAILLVAILTVTFGPLLFSSLTPPAEMTVSRPVVIVGAGELGLQVAAQLISHQEKVVIFDGDENRVQRACQAGFDARVGQVELADDETAALLKEAKSLVCTYADTNRSYEVCLAARDLYQIPHVVAQVSTPGDLARFEKIGVSTTNAALDHAALLTMVARNPATVALLTRTDDNKEIFEVMVENPQCVNIPLRKLCLPGDTLVLAIRRNGDLMVPHGNTQVDYGDYLTLVSSLEWVETGRRLFAGLEMPSQQELP